MTDFPRRGATQPTLLFFAVLLGSSLVSWTWLVIGPDQLLSWWACVVPQSDPLATIDIAPEDPLATADIDPAAMELLFDGPGSQTVPDCGWPNAARSPEQVGIHDAPMSAPPMPIPPVFGLGAGTGGALDANLFQGTSPPPGPAEKLFRAITSSLRRISIQSGAQP